MVYSPAVVLCRDDDGEWRSPVEVDVLTSAAVNAGDIRRRLEKEERLRLDRLELEYWKSGGEESRKQMAVLQRPREEAKNKNEKEIARLKKEQANMKEEIAKLKNLVKEMGKRIETDVGKAKESGSEKEEPFVEQIEDEKEEVEEKPEENQENTSDNPALGCVSDSQQNGTEGNTESVTPSEVNQEPLKDAEIQVPLKVTEEPTSSIVVAHPLSPPTQPLQAPVPDPKFLLALKNAEIQIQQTMYDRISRILHLFQLHQIPHLILGSFGTGDSKNRTDIIATIFADLLIKPGGRFRDVFQTIVFAILEKETLKVFSEVFFSADKRAQRERQGKPRVFMDTFGTSGEDVKEGDEEKRMRMMKWKARRYEL